MRISWDEPAARRKARGLAAIFLRRHEGSATVEYALLLSLIGGGILAGALALGTALVDGLGSSPAAYLGGSDSSVAGGTSSGSESGASSSGGGENGAASEEAAGAGGAAQSGGGGSQTGNSSEGTGDSTGIRNYGGQDPAGKGRQNACENAAAGSRACGGD